MSVQNNAPPGSRSPSNPAGPGDRAYRRAWWSLALYPVSLVAAFVIGEGLHTALTDGQGDAATWQILLAGTPALLVFVIPGLLAVIQGRKAMRLGRSDAKVPAIVGAVIAIVFVGQNILSFLAILLFG